MSTTTSSSRTPWVAADYAPQVTFSGANKLADSGVAPLVAAARGYETIDSLNSKDFGKAHAMAANSKQFRQVQQITQQVDAMVILWYQADLVANAHKAGVDPIFTTMQLRPAVPRVNPTTGKALKYENLTGSQSVIDTHPATPLEWFTAAPKVLITEGVLKGDSALTAQLRAAGVTDEELKGKGYTSTRVGAIHRLSELMERVPQKDRVLIVSFVGVANWKANEVWISLSLRDRQMLLAFDGDISTNWNVWSQANNLWEFAKGRGAVVKLVDLHIEPDWDAEAAELIAANRSGAKPKLGEKVGLDDFLTKHGDWKDILRRLQDRLPEIPDRARDDVPVGTWKVSEDGTSVQEYTGQKDDMGNALPAKWEVRCHIGGRIVAVETHRAPTQREIETAIFGEGVADEDVPMRSTCRIELKWLKEDGAEDTAVVTGPSTLLMYPPSEWDKKKAEIPNNLLLHPEWPPEKGQKWLSAIKDNNETPVKQNVSWTTMGYVPVENSTVCAYISGKTVIAVSKEDQDKTVAGVSEIVLPGSSKFSLPTLPGEPGDDQWLAQVRSDLADVRGMYIDRGVWTDPCVAAVVLAAGLRPTVPVRTTTVLYVQGPPGQGKSWTVAKILAFHQARKTWTNKHLPGSMKDTGTSVEQALAQTNIWVMDDLAPSADRRQSDMEQSKVGDIIRSVHNSSSKRRSGTELKAREVFDPKALLIATAENEHTINSVRDRTVILNLDKNSLTDAADEMTRFRDTNFAPARLTVAAVQAYLSLAQNQSWAAVVAENEKLAESYRKVAEKVIGQKVVSGKSIARHVGMAVDLMMGLAPVHILAKLVNDRETLELLDTRRRDNLPKRIAEIVSRAFSTQAEATPGRSLLEAIRNLIQSGGAHVLNASDPGIPPMVNGTRSENRMLGWQYDAQDKPRPLGECIGYFVGENAIFFQPTNAFQTAQRKYPNLLPPGTAASVSFGSLWNEQLAHADYLNKGGKDNRTDRVFKLNGRSTRGVPVHVDILLGESLPDAPETEVDELDEDDWFDAE
ncbi:hypothetical protein [Agromyces humi]|uniref:hypothetical protein n=1 Tax=Agromyces humi TaxID=1766800 RepID=UPI00135C28E3|nr:hypothetical protein [Agromyces humi]